MPTSVVPLQHQSDPVSAAEVAEVSIIADAHPSRLLIIKHINFRSRLLQVCHWAILFLNPSCTRVKVLLISIPIPIRMMQMRDQLIPMACRLQLS